MTERKPPGVSWESWVESQISRGLARGDFDDLPGAGRPLTGLDREQTSYEWALAWARREDADVAGMLPPGLALRRERELLPAVVPRLPSAAAVRALVEDFNARVEQYWRRPAEGPAVPVGQADVEALVERWERARPAPAPGLPEVAGLPARRSRWRFRRRRPR
jgi:hypothetical protein